MKGIISALVVATAALLIAADFRTAQPGDLTVHEWGTFTSVAGQDGSAIEWDALGVVRTTFPNSLTISDIAVLNGDSLAPCAWRRP
jgi:hypothetical protein